MSEPGKCPWCGGAVIDYAESGYYQKGQYCYDGKCLTCGKRLTEKYNLIFQDAVIVEEETDAKHTHTDANADASKRS